MKERVNELMASAVTDCRASLRSIENCDVEEKQKIRAFIAYLEEVQKINAYKL